jgi:hypothetical protein
MTRMKTMKKRLPILFFLAISIYFTGCSSVNMALTGFHYKENLYPFKGDKRILLDKGADSNALIISEKLDNCIKIVEDYFGTPFRKPVVVTVCGSVKSYVKRCGADTITRGMTNWDRIFLPPKAFIIKTQYAVLIHELTHLHTFQCIGTYRGVSNIPGWFTEGLAVLVSNGAGAEKYSDSAAYSWIKAGKHLTPCEKGDVFSPSGKNDRHLPWVMFYRQSYLFVRFLEQRDNVAFMKLINDIESGKDFKKTFLMRYTNRPDVLFSEFIKSIG